MKNAPLPIFLAQQQQQQQHAQMSPAAYYNKNLV